MADINLNPKQKSKSQHLIYNWKKANIEDMNEEVISKLDSINFNEENIHENWENFKKILTDARDKFVPSKLSTTRHNLPWYNQKLRRLAKKKQRLFNKAKKSKTKDDTKQFKVCRAEYNKVLKQARNQYCNEFLEPTLDKNGKYLFNYIKRLKKDSVGIEALISNDNTITDPVEKAEILAKEYESVFASEDLTNIPNIFPSPYPDMPNVEIKEEGVLKQLNQLNVHKSTGPDGLSPYLLKMLAPSISPRLTRIFKQSLALNENPEDWKIQFIAPILKPRKEKTEASSYRPIAITSVCSKILEHIIYSQTMDHLDHFKILSSLQHGYRNGASTDTQLLKIIDMLAKGMENKCQVDLIS